MGATVGSAQMRHLAAEALLAACQHNFNDPEVLSLALTVSSLAYLLTTTSKDLLCA